MPSLSDLRRTWLLKMLGSSSTALSERDLETQLYSLPSSTISKIKSSALASGRRTLLLGDSITQGSGSSASYNTYAAMLTKIVGGAKLGTVVNAGVAGETSGQIFARVPSLLSSSTPPSTAIIIAGTNDASNLVPLATFQSNIIAMHSLLKASGVLVVFGTVPPRASGAAAGIHTLIRQYNLWLRLWAQDNGIPLADVNGSLIDGTTAGFLNAANDSGDGVHPNNAGHLAIANAVASELSPLLSSYVSPVAGPGVGLLPDPLQTVPWSGISGAGISTSYVNAVNNDLPRGRWTRWTLNNSAGGVTVFETRAQTLSAGWSVGDYLMFVMHLRGSTAAAMNKIQVLNQANAALAVPYEAFPNNAPGPLMWIWQVPAGPTALKLAVTVQALAAETPTVDVGATDVFNLTTAGLNSYV